LESREASLSLRSEELRSLFFGCENRDETEVLCASEQFSPKLRGGLESRGASLGVWSEEELELICWICTFVAKEEEHKSRDERQRTCVCE
jgi:hypothetical protein